jgi:hypothetical protein
MRLTAQERDLQAGQNGNQGLCDAIWIATMRVGRLDLAQAARDQQEAVWALRHPSKPLRENGPVGGTGMHQVTKFLPLNYTDLLHAGNRVVTQLHRIIEAE